MKKLVPSEKSVVQSSVEDFHTEEEIRLRAIVASSPNAITVADLNGNIIDCNQAALDLFEFSSKGELIGKSGFPFIAEKDHQRVMEDLMSILEQGSLKNIQYTCLTRDGYEFLAELSASVIKDSSGNPTGFVAITKDITERKRMEDALRRSEEKYRGIVELAPDGIATVDMKGRVTSVNTAFSRLTGYPKDEIVGKHFTKLGTIRPRDIPKYIKLLSSIYRGKIPPSLEYVCLRKDGTQRYGEARLSFMIQSGKKVGVQAILRDTTERKEMEEKLRQYSKLLEELVQKRTRELSESEKKYSVLVEEASDGVIILQDEKIVFSNEKFAEIIGYSKEESIGRTIEELVDEKHLQLVKKRYQQRLRGEKIPSTYEIEVIAKTSERVPIEVSAKRINYQGRAADLIIVRDIRERKLMEEQRLKLEKLETMGELATMVAHDLRNPLTSIRTANYYIKNTCPHHTHAECKTTREMLDIIEQETLFADNIINDLLDFATKRPLQKKKQNMNNLIETSSITSNIPENIKVKTKLDKKAIAPIDAKQLQRVFLNLTKNAVQAMPNGGKLTIKTTETKDHIEIAFTDTGVGIPEENMSKIFQPLFTTKAKGIGMGLAICKRIVEQHGGTIHVKSKAGQSTTFTIKLPKKEGKNNQ